MYSGVAHSVWKCYLEGYNSWTRELVCNIFVWRERVVERGVGYDIIRPDPTAHTSNTKTHTWD